jgi:phosphoserine phosphatase RsbU/P
MIMKVLVAEDDPDSQEFLTVLLEVEGHIVKRANNGLQAWEMFLGEEPPFHVIISDWIMPELDGIELCRRMRALERPSYTFFLLLTALRGKPNYLQAIHAGADDFISKPYDPDELKARLTVAQRIIRLEDHVKKLGGILPTCMYCKRIRDEQKWVSIEEFIAKRTAASFSHEVCPECYDHRFARRQFGT